MNGISATAALAAALGFALVSTEGIAQQPMKDMNGNMNGKMMTKEQKMTMDRMVKNNLEKCYGVAARGKNDCAEGAHSCVGQASHDRDKASFLLLPKGDCQKIAGGSTHSS